MNQKERQRVALLRRVENGQLKAAEAASQLGISLRQFRRVLAAFREQGLPALAHGNRGRSPAITLPEDVKQKVICLLQSPQYADWTDTHLAEALAEREGIHVSRTTLHRWRREAGCVVCRKRRPPASGQTRSVAVREGELVEIDFLDDDWFERRGPRTRLVASVDHATGKLAAASFLRHADPNAHFHAIAGVLLRHGLFGSLYHHRESADRSFFSFSFGRHAQLGRIADFLGIELMDDQTFAANGRIKLLWVILQDRLIKEMRLEGIRSLEEANRFLPSFIERYNARFSRPPADTRSDYVPLPPNLNVQAVCCGHFRSKLKADGTLTVNGTTFWLPAQLGGAGWQNREVTVQARLDGTWAVYDRDNCLLPPTALAAVPPAGAAFGPGVGVLKSRMRNLLTAHRWPGIFSVAR